MGSHLLKKLRAGFRFTQKIESWLPSGDGAMGGTFFAFERDMISALRSSFAFVLVVSASLGPAQAQAVAEAGPEPASSVPSAQPASPPAPLSAVLYVPSRDDARLMVRGGAALLASGLVATALGAILTVYSQSDLQAQAQHHAQEVAECQRSMQYLCGIPLALYVPNYTSAIFGYSFLGLGLAATVSGIPVLAVGSYRLSVRPAVQPGPSSASIGASASLAF